MVQHLQRPLRLVTVTERTFVTSAAAARMAGAATDARIPPPRSRREGTPQAARVDFSETASPIFSSGWPVREDGGRKTRPCGTGAEGHGRRGFGLGHIGRGGHA